jgi:acyl-CoA dehydrogenase
VAKLLLEPSETRDRLTDGIFIGGADEPLGQLDAALDAVIAAEDVERRMKDAGQADPAAAQDKGILSGEEAALVEKAQALRRAVIMVDSFEPDELTGRATKE